MSVQIPGTPTPSNTRLPRSFHSDTDRKIKVMRYCEVLQLGSRSISVPMCDVTPRVTSAGTYSTGIKNTIKRAHRVHLILYSIHDTAIDRRSVFAFANTIVF